MKMYKKLIKPMMLVPASANDYSPKKVPIEPEEKWYPEEDRETLTKKFKHLETTFETLVFEEKYEEVDFAPMKDQPKWIPVKEKLPKRNGDYLVISDSPICRRILIASFAKNLDKVDKWAFPFRGENRPGWYDYSCDWGYFEHDNVTHWMPLPEMPEGE